jgi:succinate dehydrogenase / fumarate reductase cytochrome b subunit
MEYFLMSSVQTIVWSSVAKKLINAITGLGLSIFIVIHLLGNLALLTGQADTFNAYSHFLLNLGTLIYLAEAGIVIFFLFHIFTAVSVWWDKQMARPQAYKETGAAGTPSKKTISSRTMIYTGAILLIFTVLHLITFKYGPGIKEGYVTEIDGVVMRDLYRLTIEVFQRPGYVIWYVVAMGLLGFHLRHGFWSAFQSLGVNHPRWTPIIYGVALLFALVMAIGFLILPVVIYFRGGAS